MDITVKLTYEYEKCVNGGVYPLFEHTITLTCNDYVEFRELERHLRSHFKWLNENIGFYSYDWEYPSLTKSVKIYFRDKEDAMAFKLRLM